MNTSLSDHYLLKRPRRNRKSPAIRGLIQETQLSCSDLVMPFFVWEKEHSEEIPSFPGIKRYSLKDMLQEAATYHALGIQAVLLFPVIDKKEKDTEGSIALKEEGVIPKAIALLKKELPSLCVMADIALDPYTSHGHDGLASTDGKILNDETVEVLAKIALIYAQMGIDYVAPSDMMDGRVKAIRSQLDLHGFHETGIISYTAKYASSLYGPFRDTLGSHLGFGDKKTYQMNPANSREALLEAKLDEEEGADILMVKPALFYLDVLSKIRQSTHLPLAAYHVSGEYAMVMAAHEKGYLDAAKTFYEALLCIKRAGADFIISYAIKQVIDYI